MGNILIVTHYYAPDGGAAATRLTPLAHHLQQAGHQVTVLTTMPHYPEGRISSDYQSKWQDTRQEDGVRVVRVWLWATSSPRISRKLISQLSFMLMATLQGLGLPRPHVVFIEAQPIFTGVAGRIIATLKRTPYVLNVSDLWPDHLLSVGALSETSPVYRVARWVVDTGYRGAKGIVALSPAWARKITQYAPMQTNTHVILRGTDTERFNPHVDTTAFKQQHALTDAPIVSFIGTFATQYDFETQLEVAQQLPDVQFVYIGTGSQRELVQERAQQLNNVRLIDWISHEHMPAAWCASTLTYWAMNPSPLYEGTITAKLFEAFACGVPVVVAQKGESATLIQEASAGIVTPIGDATALAQALQRLIASPEERATFSQNARTYAEKHFRFEQSLQAYERLLKESM